MRYRLIVPAYVNEQIDTCIAYIAQTYAIPMQHAASWMMLQSSMSDRNICRKPFRYVVMPASGQRNIGR